MKKVLSAFTAGTIGIWLLTSCGASQFESAQRKGAAKLTDTATSGDAEPIADVPPTVTRPDKVTWTYRCGIENSSDKLPVAAQIDKATTYLGGTADLPYQIELVGEQCEGKGVSHDVVFLLDASISMAVHDPMIGGTCGRLETLKRTIARYAREGQSRFALVTFSRNDQRLMVVSNGFHASYDALAKAVSDIEGGDNFEDLICNDYHVGTDFDAGFTEASDLISKHSNPSSKLDLFFVSDGKPTCGHSGKVAVDALKAKGATIAAVSVPSHSNLMQTTIASRDAKGVPYYAPFKELDALVERVIGVTGSLIPTQYFTYRPIGETEWTKVTLQASKPGVLFVLPEFEINQATYPQGLEVQYTIVGGGQAGSDKVLSGQILWEDVDADTVAQVPTDDTSSSASNDDEEGACDKGCTGGDVVDDKGGPVPPVVAQKPMGTVPAPSTTNNVAGWTKLQ
jgi:Mg-chelatase subunit ChlD